MPNYIFRLIFLKAFWFISNGDFVKREKAIELCHLKVWNFQLPVEDSWLSIYISFLTHYKSLEMTEYKNRKVGMQEKYRDVGKPGRLGQKQWGISWYRMVDRGDRMDAEIWERNVLQNEI